VSEEENQTTLKDAVDGISKKCEIFSNPLRILIIADILVRKESNWTQLKENLEKLIGNSINPNTLGFHISRLDEAHYLNKIGTMEQPIYRIETTRSSEIEAHIGSSLIEIIRKKVLV